MGMRTRAPSRVPTDAQIAALEAIQRRVLWLATRIVDYANRERPKQDALKVGGHQASCASMVTLMTALYMWDLRAADRVSVKPHAAPVLHAIEYLQARLEGRYLTTLRQFGGLQAYPSRTKDPFPVDYSTGSVGVGAAAPLFDALADTYVQAHFGAGSGGRFISVLGDAELDEGNVWEALLDASARQLGSVLWIVDLNRQSLDRVVPVIRAHELEEQFRAAGFGVIELKYGRRLRAAFDGEAGDLLRRQIDHMPNQVYQGLFGAGEERVRDALLEGLDADERRRLERLVDRNPGGLGALIQDLGGHDMADMVRALATASADPRPMVIFAYTIKGWGLPIAGRRSNHSALLTATQIDDLRTVLGIDPDDEWAKFDPGTPEGELCEAAAARRLRQPAPAVSWPTLPVEAVPRVPGTTSSQQYLGRVLQVLGETPGVGERLVTVAPDVAVSTNLGGLIAQSGVFGMEPEPAHDVDGQGIPWRVGPEGRHIELGISEMNLFLLLGQLGLCAERSGTPLLPVGTLYDPFVCRGLDALIHSLYSGARFVFAGTPAGVTLSPEGGAHQSTITTGIGLGLPGLTYAEPCYARELEWLLLDALGRFGAPDGEALYLRLSTKPVDQAPFHDLVAERGEEAVRADVLAGGVWLVPPTTSCRVVIAAAGAVVPDALEACALLGAEGIAAGLLVTSSLDRLLRGNRDGRMRRMRDPRTSGRPHLDVLVPSAVRRRPLVSVYDGASFTGATLGGHLGMWTLPLGVDAFGQSGSMGALYEAFEISAEAIAEAAAQAIRDGAST